MPKLHHVKKARKDNPVVKKGESYYWWKFPYGSIRYSKTKPTRSQLTQSPFLAELYSIEAEILLISDPEVLEDIIVRINDLAVQSQDSLYNMPAHLQDTSDSGMLLQERVDALEAWVQELEAVDTEVDEALSEEEQQKELEDILEQIRSCEYWGG